MATLSMLLLTACQQDTENWQPNERGFLLLESVTADVQHTTQADTRTVDPSFTVEILREDGSPVHTYAPGELTTQKIQLEAGTYQLKAYSANYKEVWPSGEKGEPKYYKEQPCTIKPNQLNRVSMAIPMSNTAISLQLPEGFQEWLPSYRFTVSTLHCCTAKLFMWKAIKQLAIPYRPKTQTRNSTWPVERLTSRKRTHTTKYLTHWVHRRSCCRIEPEEQASAQAMQRNHHHFGRSAQTDRLL